MFEKRAEEFLLHVPTIHKDEGFLLHKNGSNNPDQSFCCIKFTRIAIHPHKSGQERNCRMFLTGRDG